MLLSGSFFMSKKDRKGAAMTTIIIAFPKKKDLYETKFYSFPSKHVGNLAKKERGESK